MNQPQTSLSGKREALQTVGAPETGQLRIGGRAAALRNVIDKQKTRTATQIFVAQAPAVYLTVQFDGSLGPTRQQLIEIVNGVHVTTRTIAEVEADYAGQKPKID